MIVLERVWIKVSEDFCKNERSIGVVFERNIEVVAETGTLNSIYRSEYHLDKSKA